MASLASIGVLVTVAAAGLARRSATPDTQAVVTAKVQFPFDGPQKARWSNLPGPMFQRTGVRMGDLTATQRAAVRLRGDPTTRARQGVSVGVTGALVLLVNVWWRLRPREDVS
jgi:hypothetical protein